MSPTPRPNNSKSDGPAAQSGNDKQPKTDGRRVRRKLSDLIDNHPPLRGSTDAMLADDSYEHRVLFEGDSLTTRGAPALDLLDYVKSLVQTIKKTNSFADPLIAGMASTNSMEIVLVASEAEIAKARARRADLEDDETPEGLPDTALALAVVELVLRSDNETEGAIRAQALGVSASNAIRDFSQKLGDAEVDAVFDHGRTTEARITHQSLERLATQLDATSEMPPQTVTVLGVLRGANSRGDGQFEIVSDERVPLHPVFGKRRKQGDLIAGTLTPKARKNIRVNGLWDKHVEAQVQVLRREHGRSIKVEKMRLMSVKLRPGYTDEDSQ